MMRWLASAGAACLLAGCAWGLGFAAFEHAARQPAPPPPLADGIVVLTGGAERIDTALRLLADGQAPELLISGVGRRNDLTDIAHRAPLDPAPLSKHITLGHAALTTLGNAAETASWAEQHQIRRLIVVTAGYHMPRALLEIGRRLPQTALYPAPVQPPAMRGDVDLPTLRLLAGEYNKLLAVRLGLSGLARREGAP